MTTAGTFTLSGAATKIVDEVVAAFTMTITDTSEHAEATHRGGRGGNGPYGNVWCDDGYDFMEIAINNWRFRSIAAYGEWPYHTFMWRTVDPHGSEDGQGGFFCWLVLEYWEGDTTLHVYSTKHDLTAALAKWKTED